MSEEKKSKPSEAEIVQLVEQQTGDEIALGISARLRQAPESLQEGMSAHMEGKGINVKGQPRASAAPPPKPSDAASSAKPPNKSD